MALEKKLAKGLLIAGVSLASIVINPNFEATDLKQPHRFVQKFDHRYGYDGSGVVYGVSAAIFYAGIIGSAYNVLTGNNKRK